MAVYKRWYGKKIKPGHPNYDEARWHVEFRLQGVHVLQTEHRADEGERPQC